MREKEFKHWMMSQKRMFLGKYDYYSEQATISRINCLDRLEKYFCIDLDEMVKSEEIGKEFLRSIREAKIEDLKHTPLSNAFRHYFKFSTGVSIDRIF